MVDPTFLLAAVVTGIFYGIVLQPGMHGTLLHMYTTEHVVEYAIVALFFWGVIDVLFKCARFPREFAALRQDWFAPCRGREPVSNAVVLLDQLHTLPRRQQESKLGRCLRESLEIVSEKGSSQTCREDVQRILEREDDKVHNDYTLVRFVTAVTPILGFLGTVVHFGTALSGMSFDEMTDKLPAVVAEMGMAFNTTTVALAAAMVTMFCMFICERIERSVLSSIERVIEREVVNRFEAGEQQQLDPLFHVLRSAHETALRAFSGALMDQFDRWSQKIDGLFERFDAHQSHSAQSWHNALTVLQQRHEAFTTANEERLHEMLCKIRTSETEHLQLIQEMLNDSTLFREELANFTSTLDALARGEGKLAEVQDTLSTNLRLVQQSGQFDEALHGLSAAIHLLTIRHRPTELDAAA
jgi:biopolymer transport protein ExbB/TolQ